VWYKELAIRHCLLEKYTSKFLNTNRGTISTSISHLGHLPHDLLSKEGALECGSYLQSDKFSQQIK
jgi:hypothetical protein